MRLFGWIMRERTNEKMDDMYCDIHGRPLIIMIFKYCTVVHHMLVDVFTFRFGYDNMCHKFDDQDAKQSALR
jgi:hypothetical protein